MSSERTTTSLAGLILCGGQSTRMGRSKAHLPFGNETMLTRVSRLLEDVCEVTIVVAAEGQALPPLPSGLHVARDRRPNRGPLEGLITGLTALQSIAPEVTHVYSTSCDVPMLCPAWPMTLLERIGGAAVAVPYDEQFHHPLAAVYRTDVLTALEQLSAANELRPRRLFDIVETVRVPVEQMRVVDPELDTLKNLNTPEDYVAALERCDLPIPQDMIRSFSHSVEDKP